MSSASRKKKNPLLGAILVALLGPLGFLYYSWKTATVLMLVIFTTAFLFNIGVSYSDPLDLVVLLMLAAYAYFAIKRRNSNLSAASGIEDYLGKVMQASLPVIVLFGWFGFFVGGIWLLVIGEWPFAVFGFLISAFSQWWLALPLLIMNLIAGGIVWLVLKIGNRTATKVSAFITSFFQHLVYVAWVILGFGIVVMQAEGHSAIPFILYGYSLVAGPFISMARGEPADSYGTFFALFLIEISYVLLALFYFLGAAWLALPYILLVAVMIDVTLAKVLDAVQRTTDESTQLLDNE